MIKRYLGKFNAVSFFHHLISEAIKPGQTVVDATCGNGHDTVFLAKRVTDKGKVLAIDVQKQACEATKKRVMEACLTNVTVIHDDHESVSAHLEGNVDGAVFNLGYLPGTTSRVTTKPTSTKKAMIALSERMGKSGFICVTAYVSHPGGRSEYRAVLRMMRSKAMDGFNCILVDEEPKRNPSPKVLFAQKSVDF